MFSVYGDSSTRPTKILSSSPYRKQNNATYYVELKCFCTDAVVVPQMTASCPREESCVDISNGRAPSPIRKLVTRFYKRNALVDAVDRELPGLSDEGVEARAVVRCRAGDVPNDVPGDGRIVQVRPPAPRTHGFSVPDTSAAVVNP
jgi:hypothetical protein